MCSRTQWTLELAGLHKQTIIRMGQERLVQVVRKHLFEVRASCLARAKQSESTIRAHAKVGVQSVQTIRSTSDPLLRIQRSPESPTNLTKRVRGAVELTRQPQSASKRSSTIAFVRSTVARQLLEKESLI